MHILYSIVTGDSSIDDLINLTFNLDCYDFMPKITDEYDLGYYYIEVHETQGVGKSRTQRITIYYRFVGYIDIPAAPLTNHYISETRQGVAVEYIPA